MAKYSVDEIDRMRTALHAINLPPYGAGYQQGELDKRVELQLRTYMENGTHVEELEGRAAAAVEARSQWFEMWMGEVERFEASRH